MAPDFFELADGAGGAGAPRLEELRLGEDPATILVFTRDSDSARMHYEQDPAVHGYVICPGEGCPLCRLGSAPKEYILLPVLDIGSSTVKVLRVGNRHGPKTLLDQLRPHLKSDDSSNRLLILQRKQADYTVTAETLSPHADRGTAAVTAFIEERKGGLKLSSAFTQLTSDELAGVERIRKLLDARGLSKPSDDAE